MVFNPRKALIACYAGLQWWQRCSLARIQQREIFGNFQPINVSSSSLDLKRSAGISVKWTKYLQQRANQSHPDQLSVTVYMEFCGRHQREIKLANFFRKGRSRMALAKALTSATNCWKSLHLSTSSEPDSFTEPLIRSPRSHVLKF